MKKKGFTLTEMIAVIVIIGLIILVAIPVSQNLMANNKEDKYKLYVETVEKAIYTYADLYMKTNDSFDLTSNDGVESSTFFTTLGLEKFDGATVYYEGSYTIKKTNGKVSITDGINEKELILKFSKDTNTCCTKKRCTSC